MFSKWFKDMKNVWQLAVISNEEVEALRIQSVSDDLELFKKILSMVKEKFGTMHVLSQERMALAVYNQKSDKFYSEILQELETRIGAAKDVVSAK